MPYLIGLLSVSPYEEITQIASAEVKRNRIKQPHRLMRFRFDRPERNVKSVAFSRKPRRQSPALARFDYPPEN